MQLPCFPCPHKSCCCNYGASLTDGEAVIIEQLYGSESVIYVEDEFRTNIVDGKCFFLKENKCMIHGESFYPAVCKDFPLNYMFDKTICPEF